MRPRPAGAYDGSPMKAYLFDLDGTLATSESLKARALAQTCALYGVEADPLIYADGDRSFLHELQHRSAA